MTLQKILDWHLHHYPLLQADDIYKLVYQGVFGPAHLITDHQAVATKIQEEITSVKLFSAPAEVEPVDPEGLLIRVNLAYLTNSWQRQKLLSLALLETCRTFPPKPELFPLRIKAAIEWCRYHLPNQLRRLKTLSDSLPVQTHHSEIYLRNYHPAYRVILSRLWQF
jgi:hypothetical protein